MGEYKYRGVLIIYYTGSLCTSLCSYNSACINIFIHRSRRCDHNE